MHNGGFGWAPSRFDVEVMRLPDGSTRVTPLGDLAPYPVRVTDPLLRWAHSAPERVFVAQRDAQGEWQRVTYVQALGLVQQLAMGLLQRMQAGHLSVERPMVILSANSTEHLLLSLAATYAGVPYVPVSTAYAQGRSDLGKLKHVIHLLTPGMVVAFAAQGTQDAIVQCVEESVELVSDGSVTRRTATHWQDLLQPIDVTALQAAQARINGDSIAKFLLTSGSTGQPKAVTTTHRMLGANQIMLSQAIPFVRDEPPVLVDWLPWNHTFGGSHNVNMVLFNGGSLYIDGGRPMPGGFDPTLRNLREIAPTVYLNVPKGFDLLAQAMQQDAVLRKHFFSELRACFFAGAGLSQHTWDSLNALAMQERGAPLPMISGLGATETAPSVTFTRPGTQRAGVIGLPAIGNAIKLTPVDGKLELRVKGPNVMPGYWRQPELQAASFDEEGYYCLGDAVRWVDENDHAQGLMFDGRIAEDFKLSSGTWVSVGPLRAGLIMALAPFVQDAVIAGLNQEYLSALLFPDWRACAQWLGEAEVDIDALRTHPVLLAEVRKRLLAYNQQYPGSSTRIQRAVLALPPDINHSEITDKGSINQRAVLRHRASLVAGLYAEIATPDMIDLQGP